MEPRYEVVAPVGPPERSSIRRAPGIPRLEGATLGELWNHGFRGDEIFAALRRELPRRHAGIHIQDHTFFGRTHGPEEDVILARLPSLLRSRRVDGVVSGVGA